jgi:NAD-dependent dihydropyrimidine dehydrogenase PreA subunit
MFTSSVEFQIKNFIVVMKNLFRTIHRSTDVSRLQNSHFNDRHQFNSPNGNPEKDTFWLHIDESKCIGCGVCVKICTGDVFRLQKFVDTQSQRPAIEENLKHVIAFAIMLYQ